MSEQVGMDERASKTGATEEEVRRPAAGGTKWSACLTAAGRKRPHGQPTASPATGGKFQ